MLHVALIFKQIRFGLQMISPSKWTPGLAAALVAFVSLWAPSAKAAVVVEAFTNSSSSGVGTSTGVFLTSGQSFSVSVDPADLWNAGPLPRWSNADGLTDYLFATGSDDSGEPAGTLIGQPFLPYWTQGGLTAPYGMLVVRWGWAISLPSARRTRESPPPAESSSSTIGIPITTTIPNL